MKSKKFVLAALALLAITGLLALAGCKTEVDTSSPQQEKPKVTVEAETPPTLGVRVFNATDAGLKIQLPSSFVDGSRLPFLWGRARLTPAPLPAGLRLSVSGSPCPEPSGPPVHSFPAFHWGPRNRDMSQDPPH